MANSFYPAGLDPDAIEKARELVIEWRTDFEPEPNISDGMIYGLELRIADALTLPRASGVPEAEAVAWQPHAYREQAKTLNDKLMRGGMLRVGSPVDTILSFAESVWMEGFSEGCAAPPPVAAPSGEARKKLEIGYLVAGDDGVVARGFKSAEDAQRYADGLNAASPIASEPKDAGSGEGQDIAEQAAQFLWSLLDDIDTLSDHVKADNVTYREIAERIQRRRFEVGDTDGYTVTFKRKAGIRTAPSGTKP